MNNQISSDHVIPHNQEAEMAVLGVLTLDEHALNDVMTAIPQFSYRVFHSVKMGWVWKAAFALHEQGLVIDILSLTEQMKHDGKLEEFGGQIKLISLSNATPSALGVVSWAIMIYRLYVRREALALGAAIARIAHSDRLVEVSDITGAVSDKTTMFSRLGAVAKIQDGYDAHAASMLEKQEIARARAAGYSIAVSTGLADLDRTLGGGIRKGKLLLGLALSGDGKSALIKSWGLHQLQQGYRIGWFNLEMEGSEVIDRMISEYEQIPGEMIRDFSFGIGEEAEDRLKRYIGFTATMASWEGAITFIDDLYDWPAIAARIETLATEDSCDIIYIDYLQLIQWGLFTTDKISRYETIAAQLAILAKKYKVAIVLLAQVNNEVQYRNFKMLTLDDVRGAKGVSHSCQVVLSINTPKKFDPDNPNIADTHKQGYISKHRGGVSGVVFDLYFDGKFTAFRNAHNGGNS